MSNRKGFTMVEMLIVLIIIGVLSATMMLSSGSATSSAKSMNIINNLRILKEAALMYYVDNIDSGTSPTVSTGEGAKNDLEKYLGGTTLPPGYAVEDWYVSYTFQRGSDDADDKAVQERLALRASSVGLLGDKSGTTYESGTKIYMKVK